MLASALVAPLGAGPTLAPSSVSACDSSCGSDRGCYNFSARGLCQYDGCLDYLDGRDWNCAKAACGSVASLSTQATTSAWAAVGPCGSQASLSSEQEVPQLSSSMQHMPPSQSSLFGAVNSSSLKFAGVDDRDCGGDLLWATLPIPAIPSEGDIAFGNIASEGEQSQAPSARSSSSSIFTTASLRRLPLTPLATSVRSDCLRCSQLGGQCSQCLASTLQKEQPLAVLGRNLAAHSRDPPLSQRSMASSASMSALECRRRSRLISTPDEAMFHHPSTADPSTAELAEIEAVYADALERSQTMRQQAEYYLKQEKRLQTLERTSWQQERCALQSAIRAQQSLQAAAAGCQSCIPMRAQAPLTASSCHSLGDVQSRCVPPWSEGLPGALPHWSPKFRSAGVDSAIGQLPSAAEFSGCRPRIPRLCNVDAISETHSSSNLSTGRGAASCTDDDSDVGVVDCEAVGQPLEVLADALEDAVNE